jgi:hypothetical protein
MMDALDEVLMRFRRLALALSCLAVAAGPAAAWPDAVHVRVVEQSARLMPRSLERVLASHLDRLSEGAKSPVIDERNATPDVLEAAVQAQTQRVLEALSNRSPMSIVVYEMGALSRLVALAEDPCLASSEDARESEWSPDFEAFTASRMDQYGVVLSGSRSSGLDKDDVRGFAHGIIEKAGPRYPVLTQMYVLGDGRIAKGTSFDERHPVYGVASLAYANSISDTAKLWLYAWIRSNGDASELPFPAMLPPAAAPVASRSTR